MTPETSAILVSASVTAAVGATGAVVLSRVARNRPSVAALGAPIVLVAALGAGVAMASRSMLIGGDDYRTLVFVLLAGAPMAVLVGLVLARRVWTMEREAAQERADRESAREVEDSRRETIRWLSHDLRTPLAGIRALAESLEDDAVADTHAAHGRIVHEVDRMDAMVDDIAELSRLHGSTAARVESAALDDLVSDAVATVLPLADAAGVEVSASDLSGAVVDVDARGVTRAVTNMLRNAVQHTSAGGRVQVCTVARGPRVEVDVTDGCGGIPTGDLDHVFDPGWRGDGSRHERGMGLGLTIAREVGRMHRGGARVANLDDGTGCVVTLSLPTA
ncbi:MAG: HAMP domain-containing sensor histidine kinase [Ornithinibacter sp.]